MRLRFIKLRRHRRRHRSLRDHRHHHRHRRRCIGVVSSMSVPRNSPPLPSLVLLAVIGPNFVAIGFYGAKASIRFLLPFRIIIYW